MLVFLFLVLTAVDGTQTEQFAGAFQDAETCDTVAEYLNDHPQLPENGEFVCVEGEVAE